MSRAHPADLTDVLAPRPRELADLGAIAQLRAGKLARRLPQLFAGLVLYGVSHGLMVRAALGLSPWGVLHSGLVRHTALTMGQAMIVVAVVVLLAWVPLREKPGIGTVSNAFLIGIAVDLTLRVVSPPSDLLARAAMMGSGVLLCGLASAMYIGAQLGRGPRDGLMTGLHRRTGASLRSVRTCLELGVLAVGLVMGGAVGIGTILFALTIGPLTQRLLPVLIVPVGRPVARQQP